MIEIKRFASFAAIQKDWQALEKQTTHYPFQTFWYQKLFATTFSNEQDVHLLGFYDEEILLAICGFEQIADTFFFLGMKPVLGKEEVTDFGDLLYSSDLSKEKIEEIWKAIISYCKTQKIETLQLDYLREDSQTYQVLIQNKSTIAKTTVDKQEVSPYIILPNSWDEYLSSLERKQRHELKRKIKRFEEQHVFHFCSNETITDDFDNFIRLHRLSDHAKEQFMSENMKRFFWDIVSVEKEGYHLDFCFLEMDNKIVASVMSFIGQGKALIYNSGFDPDYSYFSVGLVLHAYLIKKSIEKNLAVHDFLRGNERYKYDLGAQDMQLYKIILQVD